MRVWREHRFLCMRAPLDLEPCSLSLPLRAQPIAMEVPPPPPPANPWMATSKRHWLWLTDKYEERLQLYWGDHGKTEHNAQLQE